MASSIYYPETCPTIKSILLLDSKGKCVAVKYCSDDWSTNNAKAAFEKSLFTRTQKTNARSEGDEENELILASILQGFIDALSFLISMILEPEGTFISGKVEIIA